jgi:hypothetical protein
MHVELEVMKEKPTIEPTNRLSGIELVKLFSGSYQQE